MANTTIPNTKTYGKTLKINGDIDLPGVILTDVKATPTFEVETVEQGGVPVAGIRTLKSVEFSFTATALAATNVAAMESAIETWCTETAASASLAPAGGSTIVELGEISLIPGKAQTVNVKASYYPKMTTTA